MDEYTVFEDTPTLIGRTAVEYTYDAFGNRLQRFHDIGEQDPPVPPIVERYVLDGWDSTKPEPIGTENFDAVFDLDGENTVTVSNHLRPRRRRPRRRQDAIGDIGWTTGPLRLGPRGP